VDLFPFESVPEVMTFNPSCALPIGIGGVADDVVLKEITLPFPPTFKPLPTTPTGIVDAVEAGVVAIDRDNDLPGAACRCPPTPCVVDGCEPKAVFRLSDLAGKPGADGGANGRGGRILVGVGFGALPDEAIGKWEGLLRLADRSVHDLTFSLTFTPVLDLIKIGWGPWLRKASTLCWTLM